MRILLIIYCLVLSQNTLAQNRQTQQSDFQHAIETIIIQRDESMDYSDAIANLTDIYKNPIKINNTTREELDQLFFLTDEQIENILFSHYMTGDFVTPYQLQRVDGLDSLTIRKLIPFLSFDQNSQKKPYYISNQIVARESYLFETPKGYNGSKNQETAYLGDKVHSLLRFNANDNRNNEAGFVMEKDAGELWKAKGKPLTDYLSAYFQTSNKGIIRTLIVGDYNLSFGQGLVSGQGMMVGKSGEVLKIRSSYRGIKKHASSTENGFFRGVATTIGSSHNNITIFGSYRKLDAKLTIDTTTALSKVTTIYTTGLHRTIEEIDTREKLNETTYGASAKHIFSKSAIEIGAIGYHYNATFTIPTELYQLNNKKEQQGSNYFLNYNGRISIFQLFGEGAISIQQKKALTGGCIIKPNKLVAIALQIRTIERGYYAPRMKTFAESAAASGETGVYLATQIQPWQGGQFGAYIDVFKYNWLRYMVDNTSSGHEWIAQYSQTIASNFNIQIRAKESCKQTNYTFIKAKTNSLQETKTQSYRIILNYMPIQNMELTSRVDFSISNQPINQKTNGTVLSQEFKISSTKKTGTISARCSIFDTDGYDSRIFLYEADLLYSYTSQQFMGKGVRLYCNVAFKLFKDLTLSARISRTIYQQVETIGSGNDEITGNHKTEAKIQLLLKL